MKIPATSSSVRRFSSKTLPNQAAPAPKATNVAPKPRTKKAVARVTRWLRSELVEPDTRDEGQVAGDQGQHAWRDEGDEAGRERCRERGRTEVQHQLREVAAASPCSKPARLVAPMIWVTTWWRAFRKNVVGYPWTPRRAASSPLGSAMLGCRQPHLR